MWQMLTLLGIFMVKICRCFTMQLSGSCSIHCELYKLNIWCFAWNPDTIFWPWCTHNLHWLWNTAVILIKQPGSISASVSVVWSDQKVGNILSKRALRAVFGLCSDHTAQGWSSTRELVRPPVSPLRGCPNVTHTEAARVGAIVSMQMSSAAIGDPCMCSRHLITSRVGGAGNLGEMINNTSWMGKHWSV